MSTRQFRDRIIQSLCCFCQRLMTKSKGPGSERDHGETQGKMVQSTLRGLEPMQKSHIPGADTGFRKRGLGGPGNC